MNATETARPSQPSNQQIAAEFGIQVGSEGWRKAVQSKRVESKLQADFEAANLAYNQSVNGQALLAMSDEQRAAKEERNQKLAAAGMSHLIGAKFETSKRGTVGLVNGGKVCALNARECEAIGRKPGPGNF